MSEPASGEASDGQPNSAPTPDQLLLARYLVATRALEQAQTRAEQLAALATASELWGALARVRGQRLLT